MNSQSPAAVPAGIKPTAAPKIEALDRMSVNEKMAYFARRDAFWLPKKDGQRFAPSRRLSRNGLPKWLTPGSIRMAGGNITRQANDVIGRPCFGIPTARLVHGREHMIQARGRLRFARCGECPIKSACEFVCDERLHANEDIWEALREFRRRGGRDAFWSPDKSYHRAVGSALQKLVRHLQAANFTTVAEENVTAHYDKLALQRREAEAERQRRHRAKAQQDLADPASIPSDQVFKDEARLVRDKLCVVQKKPDCPRKLRQVDEVLMERVWAVRAKLSSLGKPHGATAIARAMEEKYPGVTLEALRKRIETILNRLPLLDSLTENPSNAASGAQVHEC